MKRKKIAMYAKMGMGFLLYLKMTQLNTLKMRQKYKEEKHRSEAQEKLDFGKLR